MFEYKINKQITSIYNECDKEYIDDIVNNLKVEYLKILVFFNIDKLDMNLVIKLWDNQDLFRVEVNKKSGFGILPF